MKDNSPLEPDGFDWVKARSQCSLARVFTLLFEIVKRNVESANELKRRGTTFRFQSLDSRAFTVTREITLGSGIDDAGNIANITFTLTAGEIIITQQPSLKPLFSARPSFMQQEDFDCMLEVEGVPLKLWQVSRRALEDLFFGG